MIGDMGEIYSDMKKESQERRASHRDHAPKALNEAGIRFDSHNAGAHLVVYGKWMTVDFWPGTGLFIARGSHRKHRGLKNLIEMIRRQETGK